MFVMSAVLVYMFIFLKSDTYPKYLYVLNKSNDSLIYSMSFGLSFLYILLMTNMSVMVKLCSLWLLFFTWSFFFSLSLWLNIYLFCFNNLGKLFDNLTDGLKSNMFYNMIDLFSATLVTMLQPVSLFLRITCNLWTHHTMLSVMMVSGVLFYMWVEMIYIWLQSLIYVFMLLLYKSNV